MGIVLGLTYFELQDASTKVESIVEKAIESNKKLKAQNDQLISQIEELKTKSDSSILQSPSAQTQQEIQIFTIAKGSTSGVKEAKNLVIKSNEEFEDIWNEVYSTRPAIPPLPEIDFGEGDVLAVFNGEKPNACYDISIKEIQVVSGGMAHLHDSPEGITIDEWIAFVVKTEPGENSVCAQMITQAFHLAAVPSWPFITFEVWTEKVSE